MTSSWYWVYFFGDGLHFYQLSVCKSKIQREQYKLENDFQISTLILFSNILHSKASCSQTRVKTGDCAKTWVEKVSFIVNNYCTSQP